mmetsp:Transcript_46741/g.138072  ORF Transcript_46741/g.138072 Transcript_46741/m.138072 type:complete len:223 (+) Transcript_46741:937-1605(+)
MGCEIHGHQPGGQQAGRHHPLEPTAGCHRPRELQGLHRLRQPGHVQSGAVERRPRDHEDPHRHEPADHLRREYEPRTLRVDGMRGLPHELDRGLRHGRGWQRPGEHAGVRPAARPLGERPGRHPPGQPVLLRRVRSRAVGRGDRDLGAGGQHRPGARVRVLRLPGGRCRWRQVGARRQRADGHQRAGHRSGHLGRFEDLRPRLRQEPDRARLVRLRFGPVRR